MASALQRVSNGIRAALSVGAVSLAVLIAQSIALTPDAQAQGPCPAWMLNVAGECRFCTGNKIVKNGACVDARDDEELCAGKGWGVRPSPAPTIFSGSCLINWNSGGGIATFDFCALTHDSKCAEVFGPGHFPNRPEDGSSPTYVFNCDSEKTTGLIPATINTISATECRCPDGQGLNENGVCTACPANSTVLNKRCVPEDEENIGTASEKVLCEAFGGTVEDATGGGKVCSGMDANDTFCIMDSAAGFPCRGLFKHLRSCNVEFNRKALNPFFCGANCGAQKAVGSECR